MINWFIKTIFTLITIYIFLYCFSFANYEVKNKNNTLGSIVFMIFTLISIIFSNIIFWTK